MPQEFSLKEIRWRYFSIFSPRHIYQISAQDADFARPISSKAFICGNTKVLARRNQPELGWGTAQCILEAKGNTVPLSGERTGGFPHLLVLVLYNYIGFEELLCCKTSASMGFHYNASFLFFQMNWECFRPFFFLPQHPFLPNIFRFIIF